MIDLPKWSWYTFAIMVFIVINITLWFHLRNCKAKGIKPKPAFPKLIKHEKQISKWTDIFIIAIILLGAFAYCSMLFIFNSNTPPDIPAEYSQTNTHLSLSVNFLLLFVYFSMAVTMASLLSPFHKNITIKKRIILIGMCGIPMVFGLLYCALDDLHEIHFYIKLLVSGLLPILFINWPLIILGKPFTEFFPRLFRKIPLPWFRIPEHYEAEE